MRIKKLSNKEKKRLEKQGRLRDQFEVWVDLHNHKLEFARTVIGAIGAGLSFFIFLKVFHVIP